MPENNVTKVCQVQSVRFMVVDKMYGTLTVDLDGTRENQSADEVNSSVGYSNCIPECICRLVCHSFSVQDRASGRTNLSSPPPL